MTDARYTASTAFLEALREAGIRCAFANLGSDHTGFIEAYSQAARLGTLDQFPELVLCPHESVALSAAHGYAQISGEPQAVLVHTDVGTQNLGGAVHNASRGRVPVLIFAGLSPVTQDGELRGTRTEHIHWLQDTVDQRGMLRGYVKHDQEIRTGRNVKQLVHRAVQLARSEPAGPVYLVAAREVMEEELPPQPAPGDWWAPVAPAALVPEVTDEIAAALEDARDPLVVTSYLGRDPAAVPALVELCELAAIAVVESAPSRLNFPAGHPLHLGFHWNRPGQEAVLAQADVILVLGSDVPWIPGQNRPSSSARIFMVDVDPVKTQLPLWYIPATRYAQADMGVAVRQLTARLAERGRLDPAAVAARAGRVGGIHRAQRAEWAARGGRRDHAGVPGDLRPRGHRSGRPGAHRGGGQLPGGQRAPAVQPAGRAVRQRWRVAGLGRRRRRGQQAGRPGPDCGQPGRGRVVPVRRAGLGAVAGPPVPGPVADRDLRQPGLAGPVPVGRRGAPGRGGGPRRVRGQLPARGRPGRGGGGRGRRVRAHRDLGGAAAGNPPRGPGPGRRRAVGGGQRAHSAGVSRS